VLPVMVSVEVPGSCPAQSIDALMDVSCPIPSGVPSVLGISVKVDSTSPPAAGSNVVTPVPTKSRSCAGVAVSETRTVTLPCCTLMRKTRPGGVESRAMLGPSTSGKLQRTSGCVNDAAKEGSPCTDTFADAAAADELALGAGLCALGCPPPLVH